MKRSTKFAIPAVALAVVVLVMAFRAWYVRRDWYEGHPMSYWAAMLRSPDPAVRARGADLFGHMSASSPSAVGALLNALSTESDADVHVRIAEALASIGPSAREAIPKLVPLLGDEHPEVRQRAASALGRIGVSQVSPASRDLSLRALIGALRDDNHDVRASAAQALGQIGPSAVSATPELARLAADPISIVRLNAVVALTRIGAPSSVALDVMTSAIDDSFDEVRVVAANSLGSFGVQGARAVPALERALDSDNAWVRRAAASALGAIGPPAISTRRRLSRALADPDSTVRDEVTKALKRIGAIATPAGTAPPLPR